MGEETKKVFPKVVLSCKSTLLLEMKSFYQLELAWSWRCSLALMRKGPWFS